MLRVNRNRIEKQLGHIKEFEYTEDSTESIKEVGSTENKRPSEPTRNIQFFYKKYRKKNKPGRPRKQTQSKEQTNMFDIIGE